MIFRPADGGDEEDEENVIQWPCSACTYLNHPLLKDCEQVIVLAKDLVIETSRTVIKGVTNLLGNS